MTPDPHERRELFSSRLGLILGALGMAIGVGNIWRFPRILAQFETGGGTFLIPWALFLFTWSIPLLAVEATAGRHTRRGVITSLSEMLGRERAWLGAFVALCTSLILCYYAVVSGWCLIYVFESLRGEVLRLDVEPATARFMGLAQGGTAALAALGALMAAGWVVARGVRRGIELASRILIPALFFLLAVLVVFGLSQEGAGEGLRWLVRVDTRALATPGPWLEALSQSAWSTGAGLGLFLVYSTASPSRGGAVQDAVVTGLGNNLASCLAALAMIPAVFALTPQLGTGVEVIDVLGHRGPGGTGFAMVWLPRLFGELGAAGPLLSAAFFCMLFVAALTSLIALLELAVCSLDELGLGRRRAIACALALVVLLGGPSALSLGFLTNQDWVWSLGLILSGLILARAALRFGLSRFLEDWLGLRSNHMVARFLAAALRFAIPIQGFALLGWWFLQALLEAGDATEPWPTRSLAALDPRGPTSIGTCLVQWSAAFLLLFLFRRRLAD